jgi:hypothetical protein
MPRAELEVRSQKEDKLRFCLGEFRRAVEKFVRCHRRQPQSKEELIMDADGNRFLRQAYNDPFTGKFDWLGGIDESGQFYVRSSSQEYSISGIRYSDFK